MTYDAFIVAAAVEAGCETLWSEDMQDGQLIDGRVRISNPFRQV
jgi:predicted nucleic acid-binding protein